jgi:E3 ubiquitin-protein ligase Topors
MCYFFLFEKWCPYFFVVFDQIIHNIKSKTEYDRHPVSVIRRPEESNSPVDLRTLDIVSMPLLPLNSVFHRLDFLTTHSPRRRFTYRTRFEATMEQNERIQELFGGGHAENDYTRLTVHGWRRSIYERNLYALPLADVTGRYRECSAEFYR